MARPYIKIVRFYWTAKAKKRECAGNGHTLFEYFKRLLSLIGLDYFIILTVRVVPSV